MSGFSEQMELQRVREEQALILEQVDNAIALFNTSGHLILFNQKLANLWNIKREQLEACPHFQEICQIIQSQGNWTQAQCNEIQAALISTAHNFTLEIAQANNLHYQLTITATTNGSRLLTIRDITHYKQALQEAALIQDSLNAEVRRLRFLLGLTERLQASDFLREIGQFALNYLVEAMNASFGDIKVVNSNGDQLTAGPITNVISGQFIATYGQPVIEKMQAYLEQGIPYGRGVLWQVVESGKPLFVDDYYSHPQAVEGFRHPGIGQLGIFPIPGNDGKIIGVLTLESRNLQKLQEAPQQDMLLAACRTLGVAIERARTQEEMRQINEDLERASQLKSEFLASMSHELRTPLNSVLGFSDLLLRQKSGSLTERQSNHVRAIEASGKHLLQLINDILDLSKIEAGKAELQLEPVSIQDLCDECLKMIQPRADKKRLALSLELDYHLKEVLLDRRRVRQILINLLSNAVKFTPERGYVKLKGYLAYGNSLADDYRPDCSPVNASTPYLCLEVQDSGIGIAREQWHLLFRPFQQIDASLTRRHEGTGLGLALTKRLAELHGGTISLQSVEHQGSRFRVWLPLTEMHPALREMPIHRIPQFEGGTDAHDAPLKTKRVLVVEDQPYNQALISEILEIEGYRVELIVDGASMREAIYSEWVKPETLPDLILMDIQLPEVDGFELIRQLKAHPVWCRVPVVAITAMAMAGDRDRCLTAGADEYLSKPLDLNQVIDTVKTLIDQSKR